MRILVFTTSYPHVDDPIAGSFVREMTRALETRGHAMTVLCAQRDGDTPIVDEGVRVEGISPRAFGIRFDTFYGGGAPSRLRSGDLSAWLGAGLFAERAFRRLRALSRSADAVLSHFIVPCGLIATESMPPDVAHIAFAHGTDAALFARMPARLQARVARRAGALQFASGASLQLCADTVREHERLAIRPMGHHETHEGGADRRRRAREALGVSGFAVLAVSRLVRGKGLDTLIDAIAVLHRSRLEVRLVIAGDGPERQELERRARGLDAPVLFIGAIDATRRDLWLDACDVFVLASREADAGGGEGAPACVVEAMGRGRACVVTRVGGVPSLVGEAAVVVQPDEPLAIASALGDLALDPARRARLEIAALARARPWTWTAQCEWIERMAALSA